MDPQHDPVVRGLSWDHPRGHAPLVAVSDAWGHARGVRVEWTRRSLAEFAGGELGSYAGEFDLVACDHPLIGRAAEAGWLEALDGVPDVYAGASHRSYVHGDRLYAAPVDAAALALARRSDLLDTAPGTFAELLDLARDTDTVAVPFSVFSAGAIYATFCAEAGVDPYGSSPDRRHALDRIADLAPYTTERGSTDLLRIAATTDELHVVAWPYGYSVYSRDGAIGAPLTFTEAPSSVPGAPSRPVLGGVGLGLLTGAPARTEALDLLHHLVGAPAQRGLYTEAGGQPAHTDAWHDPALDRLTRGFHSATRDSLDRAFVRPNAPWFDRAQPRIGRAVQDFARGRRDAAATLDALEGLVKDAA
ncbi:extracellular solute-binding protein [Streptomyces sp. NPDC060194]|uniref:extracellular solute-binding protein n=1 Tax=Streptomyces sp. NPDC060194 TaxID=3347069 RepID=UPI003653461B